MFDPRWQYQLVCILWTDTGHGIEYYLNQYLPVVVACVDKFLSQMYRHQFHAYWRFQFCDKNNIT